MACKAFYVSQGYSDTTDIQTIINDVYSSGIGCINANQSYCSQFCQTLTKSSNACYKCLSQVASCPNVACRTTTTDCVNDPTNNCCASAPAGTQNVCCPFVQSAVECGSCLNSKSSGSITTASLQACLKKEGLSRTDIILISVFTILGVILIVVVVVVTVRVKKRSQAKAKLVSNLQKEGVDGRVINSIKHLNNDTINSSIFKDVDQRLALASVSKRIAAVPPPNNVKTNTFDL